MFCSHSHTFTESQLFGHFFSYWLAVGFQFNVPHQSKFNRIEIWTAAQLNQNETVDLYDEPHLRWQQGGFISVHAELWSCLLGTREPKHFNQFNY